MILLLVLSTVCIHFDAWILDNAFVLDIHGKLLLLFQLGILKLGHDIIEYILRFFDN